MFSWLWIKVIFFVWLVIYSFFGTVTILATSYMVMFFSLKTPVGIKIGIGISNIFKENSSTALIVEGLFNATSADILIYMSLVNLLATNFMNPKMQNIRLQFGANLSLLFGTGYISLLFTFNIYLLISVSLLLTSIVVMKFRNKIKYSYPSSNVIQKTRLMFIVVYMYFNLSLHACPWMIMWQCLELVVCLVIVFVIC